MVLQKAHAVPRLFQLAGIVVQNMLQPFNPGYFRQPLSDQVAPKQVQLRQMIVLKIFCGRGAGILFYLYWELFPGSYGRFILKSKFKNN